MKNLPSLLGSLLLALVPSGNSAPILDADAPSFAPTRERTYRSVETRQVLGVAIDVCRDPDYKNCESDVNFAGNVCYNLVGQDWTNGISSIRFFGDTQCTLFDQPHCGGNSIVVTEATPNLANRNFDDKTRSLKCFRPDKDVLANSTSVISSPAIFSPTNSLVSSFSAANSSPSVSSPVVSSPLALTVSPPSTAVGSSVGSSPSAPFGLLPPTPIGSSSPVPVGSSRPVPVGISPPVPVSSSSPNPVGGSPPISSGPAGYYPPGTSYRSLKARKDQVYGVAIDVCRDENFGDCELDQHFDGLECYNLDMNAFQNGVSAVRTYDSSQCTLFSTLDCNGDTKVVQGPTPSLGNFNDRTQSLICFRSDMKLDSESIHVVTRNIEARGFRSSKEMFEKRSDLVARQKLGPIGVALDLCRETNYINCDLNVHYAGNTCNDLPYGLASHNDLSLGLQSIRFYGSTQCYIYTEHNCGGNAGFVPAATPDLGTLGDWRGNAKSIKCGRYG